MISAPVLALPDWHKPFIISSDASLVGAGAVLAQPDDKGSIHPVAYASWLFNDAQRRYHTSDRELFAFVLAKRKFWPYLFG